VHGLAAHDAWCLHFDAARNRTDDVALAVDWAAESVNDATQHGVANRHRQDFARGLNWLSLFYAIGLA